METTTDFEFFNETYESNSTEIEKCPDIIPSVEDYLSELNTYFLSVIGISNVLAVIVIIIYIKNVPYLIKNVPTAFVTKTVILCSIYPVISISSAVTVWIPRIFLLNDTISTLSFMYSAYIFFSLLLNYTEGETNFIKTADHLAFNMKTPPFFCCCPCLKRSSITKSKFTMIRWMILQLSIVQTIISVTLNIIYIEDERIYSEFFLYFVPFIATSIIIGVWGLNIVVRMIAPYYTEFKLMGKYVVLQLVLILCKLQPGLVEWIMSYIKLECTYPITKQIYKNVTMQLVIIIEMLILMVCAFKLYQSPAKR